MNQKILRAASAAAGLALVVAAFAGFAANSASATTDNQWSFQVDVNTHASNPLQGWTPHSCREITDGLWQCMFSNTSVPGKNLAGVRIELNSNTPSILFNPEVRTWWPTFKNSFVGNTAWQIPNVSALEAVGLWNKLAQTRGTYHVVLDQANNRILSEKFTVRILPKGSAGTPPSAPIQRNLSFGATGTDVVVLQNHLISRNLMLKGTNTGFFGPMTRHGVMVWQAMNNLPVTGYFGPLSRARFNSL